MIRVGLIDAADSRELRRRALRPQLGPDEPLPGDDLLDGVHVGAVDEDATVIGTCFVYPEPCDWRPDGAGAWRLRQMATAPERQRHGVGSSVLAAAVTYLERRDVPLLWCHARESAVPFYARHGFAGYGEVFVEYPAPGTPVPHLRMWRELSPRAASSE